MELSALIRTEEIALSGKRRLLVVQRLLQMISNQVGLGRSLKEAD